MKKMFGVRSRVAREIPNPNYANISDMILRSPKPIDSQQKCPLFSRLPRELRDEIFAYALLNTCHDVFHRGPLEIQQKHHNIAIPLLLTCRAIYLEAQHLPISLNAVILRNHSARFPPPGRAFSFQAKEKLRENLQAADYTLQQASLEGSPFGDNVHVRARNIKYLTIRMERKDWWTWENAPTRTKYDEVLALDPIVGRGGISTRPTQVTMQQLAQARREGKLDEVASSMSHARCCGWAYSIQRCFSGLKEMEMVFETFSAKKAQLDDVVNCAKTWEFDMGDGYVLKYAGMENGSWGEEVKEGNVEWQHGPFEVRVVRWKRTRV